MPMYQVNYAAAGNLLPLIREYLMQGKRVHITVTGGSMYPFLRAGRDIVELSQADIRQIKRGDIVMIQRLGGEYVMHRVYRVKGENIYIVGDAQQWIEGPLKLDQIVAKVTGVRRGKSFIMCTDLTWRLSGRIWLIFLPVRCRLIRLYRGWNSKIRTYH